MTTNEALCRSKWSGWWGQSLAVDHSESSRVNRVKLTLSTHISHTHVYSHTILSLLTFACFSIRLEGESHRAAATHPRSCVFTRPVAAAVVDGTGLCRRQGRDGRKERGLITMWALPLKRWKSYFWHLTQVETKLHAVEEYSMKWQHSELYSRLM